MNYKAKNNLPSVSSGKRQTLRTLVCTLLLCALTVLHPAYLLTAGAADNYQTLYNSKLTAAYSTPAEVNFTVTQAGEVYVYTVASAPQAFLIELAHADGSLAIEPYKVTAEDEGWTVESKKKACYVYHTQLAAGSYRYTATFPSEVEFTLRITQKKAAVTLRNARLVLTEGFTGSVPTEGFTDPVQAEEPNDSVTTENPIGSVPAEGSSDSTQAEASTDSVSAGSLTDTVTAGSPTESLTTEGSNDSLTAEDSNGSLSTEGSSVTTQAEASSNSVPAKAAASVYWYSSNEEIAEVDEYGTVTARKPGTCKIVGTLENKKLVCKVTVKKNSYSDTKITNESITSKKPILQVYEVAYDKKGNLLLSVAVVNNSKKDVKALKKVKLDVIASDGSTIAAFRKANLVLPVAHGSSAVYTVTIPASEVKLAKADLRSSHVTGSFLYKYVTTKAKK